MEYCQVYYVRNELEVFQLCRVINECTSFTTDLTCLIDVSYKIMEVNGS